MKKAKKRAGRKMRKLNPHDWIRTLKRPKQKKKSKN